MMAAHETYSMEPLAAGGQAHRASSAGISLIKAS